MRLGYFTEEAYERLLGDVDKNEEKYKGNDEWLDEYFGKGVKYCGLSAVQVNQFKPEIPSKLDDDSIRNNDLTNAIMIYSMFKLTPLQATNKYMWSYLCHKDKDCRAYIQKRWPDRKIEQSYFVPGGANGLYFFNSLSRLWWWAHFTYDESNKGDPFALTKILFENQMFGKDLLDTLNRNNLTRMKGVLLAVQDFKEVIGPKEGLSAYSRDFKKKIDRTATIKMFDYLDYDEIRKIAFDILCDVRNKVKGVK